MEALYHLSYSPRSRPSYQWLLDDQPAVAPERSGDAARPLLPRGTQGARLAMDRMSAKR